MLSKITNFSLVLFIGLILSVFASVSVNNEAIAQTTAGDAFVGWAWSDNIGWISFSPNNANSGGGSYGVYRDSVTGLLSGYAWADPQDSGVTSSTTNSATNSSNTTQTTTSVETISSKKLLYDYFNSLGTPWGGGAYYLTTLDDQRVDATYTLDYRLNAFCQLEGDTWGGGTSLGVDYACLTTATTERAGSSNGNAVIGGQGVGWCAGTNEALDWIKCNKTTTTTISAPANTLSGTVNVTDNIGYITFNQSELTGCPVPDADGNCSAKFVGSRLTGWARACTVFNVGCSGPVKASSILGGWDGWISLNKKTGDNFDYGPIANASKNNLLEGYAWGSDVFGWIQFDPFNNGDNQVLLPPPSGPTSSGPTGSGPTPTCDGVCPTGAPIVPNYAVTLGVGATGSQSSSFEFSTFVEGTDPNLSWTSTGDGSRTCRVFDTNTDLPVSGTSNTYDQPTATGNKSLGNSLVPDQYNYEIRCTRSDNGLSAGTASIGFSIIATNADVGQTPSSCAYPYTTPNTIVPVGTSKDFFNKSVVGPGQSCDNQKVTASCRAPVDENGGVATLTYNPAVTDLPGYKYLTCRASTFIEE